MGDDNWDAPAGGFGAAPASTGGFGSASTNDDSTKFSGFGASKDDNNNETKGFSGVS